MPQDKRHGGGTRSADAESVADYLARRALSLVTEAASSYTAAGKNMLITGRVQNAIALLTHACALLASVDDPALHAAALEALLKAHVGAGQAARAVSLSGPVDELECAGLGPEPLALLRVQLAWADTLACEPARGIARVEDARALLTGQSSRQVRLAIDAVECRLLVQAHRGGAAVRLAYQVIAAADEDPQAPAACHAWEVLGVIARADDPARSTGCFRRARLLAQQHRLPFRRLHAQLELGVDEWISTGQTARLALTRREAERLQVLPVSCMAAITIAIDLTVRGRYAEAGPLIDQCLAQADEAGLTAVLRWVILARSVLTAHQRRREEMDIALKELADHGDGAPYLLPLALQLSATVCALLEEDRGQAARELRRAARLHAEHPGPYPMTGWDGLHLLLGAGPAAGSQPGRPGWEGLTGRMPFWNKPFALLGRAALLGRQGRQAEALAAVTQAEEIAAPYGLMHHLGLRMIAEAAYRDGWGAPGTWLRKAEAFFYDFPAPAVSNACRSLLQRIGAPAPQHRQDTGRIPRDLRALGVTVREYEVLHALAGQRRNKDIAQLLYISHRTVEKHVASLLVKTGLPGRKALAELAAAVQP